MKQLIVKTSGSGEAMLVLHGWGMNSSVWEPVRESLESHFSVTWVDLPGHDVNRDVEAKSLDDIVKLLVPLLGTKTHVLGWSLGGLIAQAMLQSNPEKFCSLTLVASTPRFSQSKDWPNAMSHEVLDQFSLNLEQDLQGTIKRFIGLQFMGIKNSKDLQRSLVKNILQNLAQYSALRLGLKLLKKCDYRENNASVLQHWILGGRDRLVPVAVSDEIKQLRPNDKISIIMSAGHAPFVTHPDEFTQLLIEQIANEKRSVC